jgi:hypothetical protein
MNGAPHRTAPHRTAPHCGLRSAHQLGDSTSLGPIHQGGGGVALSGMGRPRDGGREENTFLVDLDSQRVCI